MKTTLIFISILFVAGCGKPLTHSYSTSESRHGVRIETPQPSKSPPLATRPVAGPEFGDVRLGEG